MVTVQHIAIVALADIISLKVMISLQGYLGITDIFPASTKNILRSTKCLALSKKYSAVHMHSGFGDNY